MSDVFISYSRLDKAFVGKLHDALLEKEQEIWVDWEDIPPSQSWWDEIQKGIAKANNVVLILSPYSMGSVVCHMEIEYARQLKKRIIPVLHAAYDRDTCVSDISKRLAKPEESTTREIWGSRQAQNMYDANDGDLKHINFFFFGADDDFKAKFDTLFEIIHTDYDYKELHTTLLLRATEWNKRSRDASFLLLDTELDQAQSWLDASSGKLPHPTDLQLAYIQASEKRTRQLRNIRRASIIGSVVAVLALIFALSASWIGVQATRNASLASTREASANIQVANANSALTAVPPTLTQVNQAVVTAQGAANSANTQVANAQATVTQIPPTLTQAAIVQEIVADFSNILFQSDNSETQVDEMNKVVAKFPNQATAYEVRGAFYDKRGEIDLAIKDYTQALVLDPQNSDVYALRAGLRETKGDLDGALSDFGQAIAVNPKNDNAYFNRAQFFYTTLNDPEKALADISQALVLDPQNVDYPTLRGIIYRALDNTEAALTDFTQAISLDPKNAFAYYYRGVTHDDMGNPDAALTDFDQSITFDPSSGDAYSYRGTVRLELSNTKGAIEDYDQAIALDAEVFGYYLNRGVAFDSLGDDKAALEDFNKALSLAPDDVSSLTHRAAVRFRQGDLKGAIEDYNQAVSLDPETVDHYVNRADIYFALYKAETDSRLSLGYLQKSVADYRTAESLGYTIPAAIEATLKQAEVLLTATPKP